MQQRQGAHRAHLTQRVTHGQGLCYRRKGKYFLETDGKYFQENGNILNPHRFGEKFRETGIVFVDLAVGGVEPELRGLRDEDRDVGAGRGLEVEGRGAVLEKPETSVL